jgi:hypothetical protein
VRSPHASNLKDDETWVIVGPMAADRPQDNMNRIGRLHYNASPESS